MSQLWNEVGRRYEDALAIFATAGRLVDYDDSGAVVTVNGEERLLEPATLVTAARMMARNGAARVHTGREPEARREVEVDTAHDEEKGDVLVEALRQEAHTEENAAMFDQAELEAERDERLVEPAREVAGCQRGALETLTLVQAHAVCETLVDTACDEAVCPVCEAGSTAGGESQLNQPETESEVHSMIFHDCSVLNKKNLFAGPDGYCRRCRSLELAAQILERQVQELTGPTFAELLDQVGGEEAYRTSLEDIRQAKHNGRPGNAVNGRKPRELLNLIMTQHPMFIADLLEAYRAFSGKYGIALRHDPDGVLFHDYAVFAPAQPAFPAMAPASNGNAVRDHIWQANLAQKRATRNAFVSGVRASRDIVMSWVSSDGTESGTVSLGPNTQETRNKAAEYQMAAHKKGFRTRFSLVQG